MMNNDAKLVALAKEWQRLDTAWLSRNRLADEAEELGRVRDARKLRAMVRDFQATQRKLTKRIAMTRATTQEGMIAKLRMLATYEEPIELALREAVEADDALDRMVLCSVIRDATLAPRCGERRAAA